MRLSQLLTQTVDACEAFCSTSAASFVDVPEPEYVQPSLWGLQNSVKELKSLKNTLGDAAYICIHFRENVSVFPISSILFTRLGNSAADIIHTA